MSRLKSGVSLSLTLGDVVNEKALGLTSVVAGDPHGIVLAARTSELGDPGRWVEPRTIMLTTGLLFIGHERDDAQALALITDMRAAQTTAMFFGVGVHFEEVPTALVAAARSEKFPLYTVAADVPFYAIENFVNQSKLSADAYLLKRAAWFMNELLQSMSADQPIDALIAKLASSCRGSAVLYEDSGRVVASAGEGPIRLMWTEMQRSGGAQERFTVGRWDAIGKSLVLRGKTYRLVLASRNSTMLNDLGDVLLQTTQRLLGAINGITQIGLSRELYENAQLLVALQDGISPSREHRYWNRMNPFRFTAYEALRAVAISTLSGDPAGKHLIEGLLQEAALGGLGLLLDENGGGSRTMASIHALVADSAVLVDWLTLAGTELVVGTSEPFSELASTPMAFREAETALEIARRRATQAGRHPGAQRTVVRLDEVDLASWLLARREAPQLEDKLRKFVATLNLDSDLVETLIVYLALEQDVGRSARHLYVHANTVRYRLRKCEESLGASISSTATIANLYLAFQDDVLALQDQIEYQAE
ncbi:MAG: helix-turn-helix domain-containing protein [Candidatus Saccharibacteria bacterium]|nr:helix-turn-helix domain-containing protein [Microbacteriaceae bacterium]